MKWSEVLSVVSSVASITGISLLWIKQQVGPTGVLELVWNTMTATMATLFSVGFVFFLVQGMLLLHRLIGTAHNGVLQMRILFWCFVGGGALFIGVSSLIAIWKLASEMMGAVS